jgi:putative membrane protein insertion efficiency factor
LLIFLITGYKRLISPLLPSACRFYPTCSEYMREAIEKHGPAQGVWLGLKRLGRCQPFHEGGFDAVPGREMPR